MFFSIDPTTLKILGQEVTDACREANLPEPEFNQNVAFVWVTFKRTTIQPYKFTVQPYNHTSSPFNLKGAS